MKTARSCASWCNATCRFKSSSELDNQQSCHLPKVPQIGSAHAIAKFECGNANQKVRKRNSYSSSLILPIELAGAKSY